MLRLLRLYKNGPEYIFTAVLGMTLVALYPSKVD